jgi:hypothetical protein
MSKMKKNEKKCCRYKSYLLVLMLIVSAASISFAQNNDIKYEIIEKSTDQVKFKLSCDNQEREVTIVFREANIAPVPPDFTLEYEPTTDYSKISPMNQTGDKNMVIYNNALNSEQFIVSNLEHNTDYAVDAYFVNERDDVISQKSYQISTLALEPTKQVGRISNSNPADDFSMYVYYQKGGGEISFLLVGENADPVLPKDGTSYNTTNNLVTTEKLNDNTYIISTDSDNKFKFNGLKPANNYIFVVIEANGDGDKINYLTTIDKNKRSVITQPEPPKNVMATIEKSKRIKLVWEKPENVMNYELDVALDANFKNILSNFNSIRFGDTDRFVIGGIEKNKNYFIRLRSINENGYSDYTETIIKKIE